MDAVLVNQSLKGGRNLAGSISYFIISLNEDSDTHGQDLVLKVKKRTWIKHK